MARQRSEFAVGDRVAWNWGAGRGEAQIVSIHTEDVCLSIKGTEVKRTASPDQPAYTLRQDDGDMVLKSETELEPSRRSTNA